MTEFKPLHLWRYHDGSISPNPWKVVIILNELGLPFEMKIFDRTDIAVRTKEPLASLSPNGRMPVFFDPNTGVSVWESAAIIEYLLELYDPENRLSYTESPAKHEQRSWCHFQMSGQGPYFGQRSWFMALPSAQERYAQEIKRVLGVIDSHLAKTGRRWLVGDKVSYVDFMFIPWNMLVQMFLLPPTFAENEWKDSFPTCWDWHQRLQEFPSVQKAYEFTMAAVAAETGDNTTTDKLKKFDGAYD